MAKKKWKFTDLSDDDIIQESNDNKKDENFEKNKFDLNISDFSAKKELKNIDDNKVEQKNNIDVFHNITKTEILNSKESIENNYINFDNNKTKIETLNSTQGKVVDNQISNNEKVEFTEEYKSKYDLNIDYDSDVPIKQQIKEQKLNYANNSQNKLKTFNEIVNSNTEVVDREFNSSKIQQFFSTKEKLDVKTNIYLKPNLVNEILVLSKKTGESRSAIINKLIEHALKDIKSK